MASYSFIGGKNDEISRNSGNSISTRLFSGINARRISYIFINIIGDGYERSGMVQRI